MTYLQNKIIFFVLIYISIWVNGFESIYNPNNKHWYQLFEKTLDSFNENFCNYKLLNGKQGYIVTLTSKDEELFIKNYLSPKSINGYYISGKRNLNNQVIYNDGPEKNDLLYYSNFKKDLNFELGSSYFVNDLTNSYWKNEVLQEPYKYICEFGGLEDPIIKQINKNKAIVSNINQFDLENKVIRITFKNDNTGHEFKVSDIKFIDDSSFVIPIETGTGVYHVTIDINGEKEIYTIFEYQNDKNTELNTAFMPIRKLQSITETNAIETIVNSASSISPLGGIISIHGSGLGDSDQMNIKVGHIDCFDITRYNENLISCQIITDDQHLSNITHLNLTQIINSNATSYVIPYKFLKPVVTNTSSTMPNLGYATKITIDGDHFGGNISVSIDHQNCSVMTVISRQRLVCAFPGVLKNLTLGFNYNTSFYVEVTVNGVSGGSSSFYYTRNNRFDYFVKKIVSRNPAYIFGSFMIFIIIILVALNIIFRIKLKIDSNNNNQLQRSRRTSDVEI